MLRTLQRSERPALAAGSLLRELRLGRGAARPLRALLRQLVREGALERVGGRYRAPRPDGLVEGRYAGGAVTDDGGRVWPVRDAADARAGDRVLLLPLGPTPGGGGDLLQVLDGERAAWIGILRRRAGAAVVVPYRDDGRWELPVPRRGLAGARDGDVVVAAPGPAGRGRPRGRVIERLGRPGDPEADARAVAWRHRLPDEFPPDALAEADSLPETAPAFELARRVDLRDRPFVTIDPTDARDHDDAVWARSTPGDGGRLFVAVADVAHYVAPGSALDREARRRGNSVYFPDRALPMLPEGLSAQRCSLRPGVDRLVLVVELAVDAGGRVSGRSFYPAVIRSRARLSYAEAARAMEGEVAPAGCPAAAFGEPLRELARLTRRLGRRRLAGGSLDLELPEAEVRHGADGRPCDVVRGRRSAAHRVIEEAMLAANRAVAGLLAGASLPALFRNHDAPLPGAAEELRDLLAERGLHGAAEADELSAAALARILERVAGRPDEEIVRRGVLRAMCQARYGARNAGHFALAFANYTHFTSPIRRYADLSVHRVVKALLAGEAAPLAAREARALAGRTSWLERRAERAEREMLSLARCAVMASRLGEEFAGRVTGVARHGLYVTLDAPFVEGLVHVSRLAGFVEPDPRGSALVERRSGRRFALGDRLRVRAISVDPLAAHVDLALVGGGGRGDRC